MKKWYEVLLFSTILLFMNIANVNSIILAPGIVELELMPGQAKVFELNVINKVGEKPIRCRIYVTDVEILREGRIEYPKAGTVKYSCANWIEVSPQEIYLKGGEVKKIECRVLVPPGVTGSHAGAIMCELIPDVNIEKEAAVVIHLRIASIVKLNIGKIGLNDKLIISDMNISKKNGTTSLIFTLKNDGNTYLIPKGTVTIKNKQGRIFTTVPLTSITYTMFPEDIRYFKAILDKNLPDGEYIAQTKLEYGKKKWLINNQGILVKDGIITKKLAKEKGGVTTEEFVQVSIKPSSIELSNLPRRVFRSGVIQIYNDDTEPVNLEVELKDVSIDSNGQIKYLSSGNSSYSCAELISLFPTSFSIAPNKQGYVKYSVKISEKIEGGRYGAILFKITSSSTRRTGEHIIPIGITILDTLRKELKVSQLEVSSHVRELKVSFLLENQGNVQVYPKGKIIIKDKTNKVVEEIPIKKEINIFPTESRKIELFHTHNLNVGNYTAEIEINYDDKKSVIERKEFSVIRRKR